MAHLIDKDAIKQKVQEKLLNACARHYEAERALCELVVPQQWVDNRDKAYEEFIWRCQDYQEVNDSDNIDIAELNYDYI